MVNRAVIHGIECVITKNGLSQYHIWRKDGVTIGINDIELFKDGGLYCGKISYVHDRITFRTYMATRYHIKYVSFMRDVAIHLKDEGLLNTYYRNMEDMKNV